MKKNYCTCFVAFCFSILIVALSVPPAHSFYVRDNGFTPTGFASGTTIFAVAEQSDGKVLVGGSFTYNTTYPNGCPWAFYNLVRFPADQLFNY